MYCSYLAIRDRKVAHTLKDMTNCLHFNFCYKTMKLYDFLNDSSSWVINNELDTWWPWCSTHEFPRFKPNEKNIVQSNYNHELAWYRCRLRLYNDDKFFEYSQVNVCHMKLIKFVNILIIIMKIIYYQYGRFVYEHWFSHLAMRLKIEGITHNPFHRWHVIRHVQLPSSCLSFRKVAA